MSHKRRIWTDWKMLCVLFVIGGIFLAVAFSGADPPPYKFLERWKRSYSGVDKLSGFYIEVQAYSRSKFSNEMLSKMFEELHPLGFDILEDGSGQMHYVKQDVGISLEPGMSWPPQNEPLFDKVEFFPRQDFSKGITIVIRRRIPDSWLTKLRMALQRK